VPIFNWRDVFSTLSAVNWRRPSARSRNFNHLRETGFGIRLAWYKGMQECTKMACSTQCISMLSALACGILRPHPVGLNVNPRSHAFAWSRGTGSSLNDSSTWTALVSHAPR
jgi:hypothetical protein